ncbi:MAG: guanylate kinase [Legionellales bacterium]|nr:guanylate kinase [Legionellales bacterium]
MQDPNGTLYIISAPSGCGKTSLVRAVISGMDDILVSISHTTRPARPGEQDGINYFFIDESTFQAMIESHQFLEHASIFGNWYGTSKQWVQEQLALGKDVILEIDWQGARQIKWMIPESIGIFILPPTLTALQTRLEQRAQDKPEIIAYRMAQANIEISHYHEYEFIIINDDFERALDELKAVILSERLKLKQQLLRHGNLLRELTK